MVSKISKWIIIVLISLVVIGGYIVLVNLSKANTNNFTNEEWTELKDIYAEHRLVTRQIEELECSNLNSPPVCKKLYAKIQGLSKQLEQIEGMAEERKEVERNWR